MILPILGLILISLLLSAALTFAVRKVAISVGFVDKPGHRKIHDKPKALGGGIALFWSMALPIAAGVITTLIGTNLPNCPLEAHRSGLIQQLPMLAAMWAGALALHVMGLIDDRKALGPYSKLIVQLLVAASLVICFPDFRLLSAAGPVLSALLTVLWIAAITNALNFLDNMDGLAAGVSAVACAAFLVVTLTIGQWFIASMLAVMLGACLGFLIFNRPPASIFMGDSGSLLLGYWLAVMTVRTTFLPEGQSFTSGWYAVLAPLLVLAVPLYDLTVVSVIRLAHGKSPFRGDTNHFSHRLVARGFSKPAAVAIIWLITAATALGALLLTQVTSWTAAWLVLLQTALLLAVVMVLEEPWKRKPQ